MSTVTYLNHIILDVSAREMAQHQFSTDFPTGYTLLPTDGTALLCGLHALRLSIAHQFLTIPWFLTPNLDELFSIATTGDIADRLIAAGRLIDEDNFAADQVAGIWEEVWVCSSAWNLVARW